jgi:hypothetical protein
VIAANLTIDPGLAGTLAGMVAIFAGAWYVGRQRGAKNLQDEAVQALTTRVDTQGHTIVELRDALADVEQRRQDEATQCKADIAHLQGQLDAVSGDLIEKVGERIGRRIGHQISLTGSDVAKDVATKVIEHLEVQR